MKKIAISRLSSKQKRKIKDAERHYRKIWEEVKPFIKRREIKKYSTTGEWKISSHEL